MNRKIIAIFFIILTLGGNQAKDDFNKQLKCKTYDKEKILECLKNQLTTAFTYQSVSTFASFIISKIAIWLAGFSATGPVAGSLAAWIQSLIGNVVSGSLFSFLQAVAMGKTMLLIIPSLTIGSLVGLIYLVFSCFRSEYCISEEEPKNSQVPKQQTQRNQKLSQVERMQFEQKAKIEEKQQESFWSSSFTKMKSGLSDTLSIMSNQFSELSNSLPSLPKEVVEMNKKVLEYSSNYLSVPDSISEFTNNFLEFSSQVVSSIQKELEENIINIQNTVNQLTSTFDDYVDGITDLFEFIWNNREIIMEAFEYSIFVLKEQFDSFMYTQHFIDKIQQSKKKDACMNNFIELLANA